MSNRVGAIAFCCLAGTGMPTAAQAQQAQSSINIAIPQGTATTYTLNGTPGSTSATGVAGMVNNSIFYQIAPASSSIASFSTFIQGLSTTLIPNTDTPNPTSLSASFTNATTAAILNGSFQLLSTGGISTINSNQFQNIGSALSLTSTGVGAWANLDQATGFTQGFLIQSVGGAGISTTSPTEANGASGGAITASLTPLQGSSPPFPTSILVSSQLPWFESLLPWQIQASGIQANSIGGQGAASSTGSGKDPDWAGNGGAGGPVSLNVSNTSQTTNGTYAIYLGTPDNPLYSGLGLSVAGIVATSLGASGGPCCSWDGKQGSTITPVTDPSTVVYPIGYGLNGAGGPVSVNFSGLISGTASNLYGIVATSVGASTQLPTGLTNTGGLGPAMESGLGGAVDVSLVDGSINLGSDSIGVFAASLSDQVILPSTMSVAGTGNTAGSVQVSLDADSLITVGAATGQFSAGLLAISSTGWLFQPMGVIAQGAVTPGNGGNITISNNGTISATQNSAIGIAALSLGNGGLLLNAPATTSTLNYISSGNAGANQSNSGGTVQITNNGAIQSLGDATFGVLAASNGSGGLIVGIPDAIYGSSANGTHWYDKNIQIGSQPAGYVAGAGDSTYTSPGGSVTLTNSGSIQSGGGDVALGILAQSVGGGGASYTEGVALFVGDAGGQGGDGGPITLNNSGSISTSGDGSIGFLGQSIGGGGGHGANTRGLFVAVGGNGGNGGSGATVSANLEAGSSFSTSGDYASGMVLQSIGGGGGNGGYGKAYGIFFSTGIGGAAGSGGTGGTISLATSDSSGFQTTSSGDQSHGLLVQSIGGGGGNGGHAYSYSAGVVFAGAVGVGGSGGFGGSGGTLNLCPSGGASCTSLNGAIATAGSDAVGVLLQSIGSGGGYGGGSLAKAYAVGFPVGDLPPVTISLAASVGGSGGSGGNGGAINMVSGLTVSTAGTGAHAIAAQSIGGGGGAAADSSAGANSYDNSKYTFNAALSLGGSGGVAGNGGAVNLTTLYGNTPGSQVSTLGHNAAGILAQSIGGGGGYGGIGNAYSNVASIGAQQLGLSFGLGGSGSAAGTGGSVNVINGGGSTTFTGTTITTTGSQSPGILAQSIGGGGGVAGNGGAQSIGGNHNLSVAVGGNAGSGSTGGTVTVINAAAITTGIQLDLASGNQNSLNLQQPIVLGGDSHGIVAQSIGGGGGIGGNADPSAALISNVQTLLNEGAADYVNVTGMYQFFTSPSAGAPINYNGSIAIGGNGGSGGDGQAVSVTHQNSLITTYGHRSYGILAQSIGGGGGIGGSSTASSSFLTGSATATILSGFTLGLGINVGGSSGSGGNGGAVSVNVDFADIVTAGYASHAIVGQSIGGGGGAGHDGSVFNATAGVGPAPSISVNPSVTLGSLSGGAGMQGVGGSVSVTGLSGNAQRSPYFSESLVTLGDAASAVLLQSIGGGGGVATYGCTNSGNAPAPSSQSGLAMPITASACLQNATSIAMPAGGLTPAAFQGSAGAQGFDVSLLPSAGTGSSSAGGAVSYTNDNLNLTVGNRSIGVVAQSIGGGGGYVAAPAQTITTAQLPSGGTNNSPGGNVTVVLGQGYGNGPFGVNTAGSGAWGILAQSIGGGGGFIGDSSFTFTQAPEANLPGSNPGSTGADGGTISITLGSPDSSIQPGITTNGPFAHGIVAQSIGGGGGIAMGASQAPVMGSTAGKTTTYAGSGGGIALNIYGTIKVLNHQSIGVFAQSSGSSGTSAPISINLDGSILVSADSSTTPTGAAIMISGGSAESANPNTVTVGSGGLIGATNTTPEHTVAIIGGYGYTKVINQGTINGSIELGGKTHGEIINTGTLNAGPLVVVSNNSLHNYGLMRIGALETISRTSLTGRFVQHESGTLDLSIDSSSDSGSDYLAVFGPLVLGGMVVPYPKTLLRGDIEFASADDIVLNARTPETALLFDWKLWTQGNRLLITPMAEFTPASLGLTTNQRSLAHYLQRSWNQGEPSDAGLFSHLYSLSPSEGSAYVAILDQLAGAALNSQPIQMKTMFFTALDESLACPTVTPEGLKPNQRHCVWARATGDYTTQAGNDNNSGYWVSAPGIRLGAQSILGGGWTGGLAFGYGTNYLRSDNFSSNGDFFDLALGARKQFGNWEIAGSLAYAQGWFENTRLVQLPTLGVTPGIGGEYSSDSSFSMLGLRLRAAYNHHSGNHHFKPYLNIDLSQSWMPAYRESPGDFALKSSGSSDFNIAFTPMLEYTLYSAATARSGVRAYLSAGASWLPDNRVSASMAFRGDQRDNGTFNVVTDGAALLGRLNLGAEASIATNLELRAEYNLQSGGGYLSQAINANLRYRF